MAEIKTAASTLLDTHVYTDVMCFDRLAFMLLCLTLVGCDRTTTALVDSDGRPFQLWQSSLAPPATVLIFTRSDCPISNRYAPTVRALYDTYHPRGIELLLVYVDPKETPATIRSHLDEYHYPCNGVHDPLHELVTMTAATVTPEAVIFDSNQKLVYRGRIDDLYVRFGEARPEPTSHDLVNALDAILANQPVVVSKTKAIGCYIGDLK